VKLHGNESSLLKKKPAFTVLKKSTCIPKCSKVHNRLGVPAMICATGAGGYGVADASFDRPPNPPAFIEAT